MASRYRRNAGSDAPVDRCEELVAEGGQVVRVPTFVRLGRRSGEPPGRRRGRHEVVEHGDDPLDRDDGGDAPAGKPAPEAFDELVDGRLRHGRAG